MMFFCSLQLSSDVAVKRILAGERADVKGKPPSSKSREKESQEPKAEEEKSHREVGVCSFCGVQGQPLFMVGLVGFFFVLACIFVCVK